MHTRSAQSPGHRMRKADSMQWSNQHAKAAWGWEKSGKTWSSSSRKYKLQLVLGTLAGSVFKCAHRMNLLLADSFFKHVWPGRRGRTCSFNKKRNCKCFLVTAIPTAFFTSVSVFGNSSPLEIWILIELVKGTSSWMLTHRPALRLFAFGTQGWRRNTRAWMSSYPFLSNSCTMLRTCCFRLNSRSLHVTRRGQNEKFKTNIYKYIYIYIYLLFDDIWCLLLLLFMRFVHGGVANSSGALFCSHLGCTSSPQNWLESLGVPRFFGARRHETLWPDHSGRKPAALRATAGQNVCSFWGHDEVMRAQSIMKILWW